MNTCHNNPEKSSRTKINKHTPSGYLLFTHCSFDTTKNKLDCYGGKNRIRNVFLELREEVCHICKKRFSTDDSNKKYHKVRDH